MGIFGSDARKGETASRSDVTMLARIDPDKGVVDLISVPRDTMINIEGHGHPEDQRRLRLRAAPPRP